MESPAAANEADRIPGLAGIQVLGNPAEPLISVDVRIAYGSLRNGLSGPGACGRLVYESRRGSESGGGEAIVSVTSICHWQNGLTEFLRKGNVLRRMTRIYCSRVLCS